VHIKESICTQRRQAHSAGAHKGEHVHMKESMCTQRRACARTRTACAHIHLRRDAAPWIRVHAVPIYAHALSLYRCMRCPYIRAVPIYALSLYTRTRCPYIGTTCARAWISARALLISGRNILLGAVPT
jgi:hypothetical protein